MIIIQVHISDNGKTVWLSISIYPI